MLLLQPTFTQKMLWSFVFVLKCSIVHIHDLIGCTHSSMSFIVYSTESHHGAHSILGKGGPLNNYNLTRNIDKKTNYGMTIVKKQNRKYILTLQTKLK